MHGHPIPAPTGRDLIMRDPARAAAFGLLRQAPEFQGHFGGESTFGEDYFDPGWHAGFGDDNVGSYTLHDQAGTFRAKDWGKGSVGFQMARAKSQAEQMASHAAMARLQELERKDREREERARQRRALIDPNEGSDIKVERYGFQMSQIIPAIGTTYTFANFFNQPDSTIRPERVLMNAPAPGFVIVNDLKVNNISGMLGGGAASDAFFFGPGAFNAHLGLPKIIPGNKFSFVGYYTGLVPPGYGIMPFPFCVQVNGAATIAGSE